MPRNDLKRWENDCWSVHETPEKFESGTQWYQIGTPTANLPKTDSTKAFGLVPSPINVSADDLRKLRDIITEFLDDPNR